MTQEDRACVGLGVFIAIVLILIVAAEILGGAA